MKTVNLLLSTAVLIIFLVKRHSACFIGQQQTLFTDRINNSHQIWQSQVFSVLSCQRQCFRQPSCMSFFYNELTSVCSLQSIVYLYEEQASTELGSRYFVPIQQGKCPETGGFMHNRALEMCYNFKCCDYYNAINLTAKCHAAGATLIKIDSAAKQDHIAAFLGQEVTPYTLIQGTRNEDNGIYSYDDGTPMSYFNWNTDDNEPEEKPEEIYIVVKKNDEFRWHDTRNIANQKSSNLVCETPVM